jgi:hypothetical protein
VRVVPPRNPPGPRNLPAPRLDKARRSAKLGAKGTQRDAIGQETEDLGVLTGEVLSEGMQFVLRPLVVLVRVQ